jgi:diacylglycerol O-acyltransferase
MVQQLSAQDAQFVYFQSGDTHTHIMGIYIYDPSTAPGGKVRFRDIVQHVERRMHTSPVFRRKLLRLPFDLDHPYGYRNAETWFENAIGRIEKR